MYILLFQRCEKVPDKKGSGRLDCLEGMRAISMTWVILGHNFGFGGFWLHVRNKEYVTMLSSHQGPLALEGILAGEFSVDTFFFIGATLLSYLLLKDLDKSNGWFHSQGLVRMMLFYVNRILRITIPYALALGTVIGLVPLMATQPIGAAQIAKFEAEICKEVAWRHLTYSHIFRLEKG